MSDTVTDREALAATYERMDAFHRRFHEAALNLPVYDPVDREDRRRIAEHVRHTLGLREQWIPTPDVQTVRTQQADGFVVHFLSATTWPNTCATAMLYMPDTTEPTSGFPFVFLACGHGQGGKHNATYQRMARHLARRGAVVLCPDNIGQGERTPMGHGSVVGPFAAGLSLQGLIVMESLGWLRWATGALPIDADRLAAIGNSGGGTLTLMMIPFASALKTIVSSGYPSSFNFIARKEKKFCHCNILPGIVRRVEMHHIYSCFAPKPMLLLQGEEDRLIPAELFHWNARHVRRAYEAQGAAEHFRARLMPGAHAWDAARIEAIGEYLAEQLGLERAPRGGEVDTDEVIPQQEPCLAKWPGDVLDANGLAAQLTGKSIDGDMNLWDVFPFEDGCGAPLPAVTERGDSRQILAQFQAFLEDGRMDVVAGHV